MSFADDVTGYQSPRPICSVVVWRASQDTQTQAEFDTLISSDAMTKAIWLAMRSRGYTANQQAVARHRKGDCKCPSPVM